MTKRLTLQVAEHGAILRFEDGTRNPPTAELSPADVAWLAQVAADASRCLGEYVAGAGLNRMMTHIGDFAEKAQPKARPARRQPTQPTLTEG